MATRSTRRFIGYPIDSLLVVLPDAEAAAALRGSGIPDRDITIMRGEEGADRLDGTGAVNGPVAPARVVHAHGPAGRYGDLRAGGRFATEEAERWHGPEPNGPGLLRR